MTLGQGQISLKCQFQRSLYRTLCVLSQIKDRKHIEQNFHSVAKSCPGVGLRGAGGVKNFSEGICDGAPSTACSSCSSEYLKLLELIVYVNI